MVKLLEPIMPEKNRHEFAQKHDLWDENINLESFKDKLKMEGQVTEKTGGIPGTAIMTFLPCAEAGAALIISAATSAPPAASENSLLSIESSVRLVWLFVF